MARAATEEQQAAEDIAAQKAARSAAYRQSQTFRSLLVALGAAIGVAVIVVLIQPPGAQQAQPEVDVAAAAETVENGYDRQVLVPGLPSDWGVNVAEADAEATISWNVVYTPPDNRNFIKLAQGFDSDETWAARELNGVSPNDTVTIDGIEWDVYEPGGQDNVSYALGTQAGPDHVLLYGSASADTTAVLAETLSEQLAELQGSDKEEAP